MEIRDQSGNYLGQFAQLSKQQRKAIEILAKKEVCWNENGTITTFYHFPMVFVKTNLSNAFVLSERRVMKEKMRKSKRNHRRWLYVKEHGTTWQQIKKIFTLKNWWPQD
jgi:hypothetical protein